MTTTTRTVANSPSLTATLSNPLLPNDSFTSVIAEEPDSDCSDGNKRQSGRCLEDWLKSEYLANFGAQFNLTNLPIALLFLSEKDKWYTDDMWNGNASSTLKSAVFVGAILGMVSLGYVGDIVGRNNAFAITSLIMVVFCLASAFAPCGNRDQSMAILAAMRFGLGVGIGGCYPLSAAKSSEGAANASARNRTVGINLIFQSLGNVAPYAVAMCLVPLHSAVTSFRVMLSLGAVPPFVVLLCTYGHVESDVFSRECESAQDRRNFLAHIREGFREPRMCRKLLATALAWCIYDIGYYGVNQFLPEMTTAIFGGDDDDDSTTLQGNARVDAISMAVGVPAVLHAVWALDGLGTKRLQLFGFLFIACASCGIAAAWRPLSTDDHKTRNQDIIFVLSLVLVASVNWGPNVSTFVLPQQVFPTRILGLFGGFAAASGKVGAVAGVWIFESVYGHLGMVPLMLVVASINLVGAWISHTCIEEEGELPTKNPPPRPQRGRGSSTISPPRSSTRLSSWSNRPTEASSHTSLTQQ